MADASVERFYDRLAADYHLVYHDWDASMSRQSASLHAVIGARLGTGSASVLDCSCGIGTQAVGLSRLGHRVTGTDLSRAAVARAVDEAAARAVRLPAAVADMRRLPFADARFDAVLSADNSLPHLLTGTDVLAALTGMRRVLRGGGLLMISTRPYDEILRSRPRTTAPQLSETADGQAFTFQVWDWHDDGERYDLRLFRLLPRDEGWHVEVGRTTYWALTQRQLTDFVLEAGFEAPRWHTTDSSGFFQPLLTALAP